MEGAKVEKSKSGNGKHVSCTRREFLGGLAGAGVACALQGVANGAPATQPGEAARPTTDLPTLGTRPSTGSIEESAKSIVVHIQALEAISGQKVHPTLSAEMVEEALKHITGQKTPADAWHAILKPDDRIGLKFNHVGEELFETTVPFATQLVGSLTSAGFSPKQIMLIEAPAELSSKLKTRPEILGWAGPEVSFGSGKEQLAAALGEVTAIINVPFLKTHNLAGMTGCLKNLSHAFIRHPARYHANGCAPFVGDIVALPHIRSKLRLHVFNALKACYDGGPQPTLGGTWIHGGVIVSTDPVAADSVGLDIINERRARAKLRPIGDAAGRVPHIHAAAERGLGTDDQDYIRLLEPAPF
jgi:hypothetical protein